MEQKITMLMEATGNYRSVSEGLVAPVASGGCSMSI